MKKYFLAIIIVIAMDVLLLYQNHKSQVIVIDLPEIREYKEFVKEDIAIDILTEEIIEEAEVLIKEKVKPILEKKEINSINLAVPFTSQAPTANWDQPFQDACEEAAVLMLAYYYKNKNMPSKEKVENILTKMVNWEEDFMTGSYDIDIEDTGQLAKGFFGYDTEVVVDLTAKKIRDLLREGIPIIVPANGRILDNPNFTDGGPHYHMIVIKGFVDDKFITNDPGTRNGEDFIYTEENLMVSIADLDKEKALATGPKVGLILTTN